MNLIEMFKLSLIPEKFGYIGVELFIVGLLLYVIHKVTPKDMPLELKTGYGLMGAGVTCLLIIGIQSLLKGVGA